MLLEVQRRYQDDLQKGALSKQEVDAAHEAHGVLKEMLYARGHGDMAVCSVEDLYAEHPIFCKALPVEHLPERPRVRTDNGYRMQPVYYHTGFPLPRGWVLGQNAALAWHGAPIQSVFAMLATGRGLPTETVESGGGLGAAVDSPHGTSMGRGFYSTQSFSMAAKYFGRHGAGSTHRFFPFKQI